MTTNDPELTQYEVLLKQLSGHHLSEVIRNRSIDAVIIQAAKIEDAARKLGWRALELQTKK
jgi:hypothetical protein